MSKYVKRTGDRLEVTSLFGTRWVFHPTIKGAAVGIYAFREGNNSGEADVRVGLGAEQSLALRDYLVEQLGAPEGYVKATEVKANQDGPEGFKEGDRVRILDGGPAWAKGQVGTVGRPAAQWDHWVTLDDGRLVAVWDKEIEPYTEPERVYKFKVGDKVKVTTAHRNGQVGVISEVDPKGKHYPYGYDYNVKFDEPGAALGVSTLGYNEDELEAYREPTNEEVRDALPNGSVIRFNRERGTWHKVAGKWLDSDYRDLELTGTYNEPGWTQHVVFDPSEKQED